MTLRPWLAGATPIHVAVVPAGVTSRDALFDVLTAQLALPDYFGRNWDALYDALSTLEWLPVARVILVHEAAPALPAEGLATYRELLDEAVAAGARAEAGPRLVVVWPPAS